MDKLQVGHANQAWLCLDLLDILCQLAERGHACTVRSMLQYPLQHCPEILLIGMAYINVLHLYFYSLNLRGSLDLSFVQYSNLIDFFIINCRLHITFCNMKCLSMFSL